MCWLSQFSFHISFPQCHTHTLWDGHIRDMKPIRIYVKVDCIGFLWALCGRRAQQPDLRDGSASQIPPAMHWLVWIHLMFWLRLLLWRPENYTNQHTRLKPSWFTRRAFSATKRGEMCRRCCCFLLKPTITQMKDLLRSTVYNIKESNYSYKSMIYRQRNILCNVAA